MFTFSILMWRDKSFRVLINLLILVWTSSGTIIPVSPSGSVVTPPSCITFLYSSIILWSSAVILCLLRPFKNILLYSSSNWAAVWLAMLTGVASLKSVSSNASSSCCRATCFCRERTSSMAFSASRTLSSASKLRTFAFSVSKACNSSRNLLLITNHPFKIKMSLTAQVLIVVFVLVILVPDFPLIHPVVSLGCFYTLLIMPYQ